MLADQFSGEQMTPADRLLTEQGGTDSACESSLSAGMPDADFIDLFVKSQRRLYLFLLTQTASPQAAEEILQNTNVVILSKWASYVHGTNFLAWVYRIASLELLKYRQQSRKRPLQFDDGFIDNVVASVETLQQTSDERRQALSRCLDKLRPQDRKMIQLRYQLGGDGKMISDQLNRPVNSIYQSLGRIRRTLLECIERELAASGRS